MSRPSFDREDLYVQVPRRFYDALARGEITGRQFRLGCHLAGAVHWKTGEVSLTLRALADGCDWTWSEDTLLRDLRALRPAWIEFEVGQGQRRPYVFRLTGLRRREEGEPPLDFRTETPSPAEVTPTLRKLDEAGPRQPERDSPDPLPASGGSPKKRREETSREKTTPRSEEEQGTVVGEGTPGAEASERLVAAVESVNGEGEGDLDELHEAMDRARAASRHRDDDLDAIWPGPPVEGEEGILADLQMLADAGLGRWIEEVEP